MSTGTRGVLATLISEGYVDAVITTCGTLDHDLARAFRPYFHGDWNLDDSKLHRQHRYRLGNLVIPQANYGTIIERRMRRLLLRLWRRGVRKLSTCELTWAIGEDLTGSAGRGSIARAAYDAGYPSCRGSPTAQ